MASAGKKGKKAKGTVISLQSFLSNRDTPSGTTQVTKKIRNVDGDDSDDGNSSMPKVYQLPTAPRANRVFDDVSIPHKSPFIAYVTNLPFDANEDDVYDFFGSTPVVSLRLPREDGETGRVRGFGYVEFESRDDLIHVLSLPDPSIKGRRIRIELSNENELQSNRQKSNRRGFDNFGNSAENRDSTNWRRETYNQDTSGFGNHNHDRGFNRDRKVLSEDCDVPGSWRSGNRPVNNLSPRSDRLGTDRNRDISSRDKNFDRVDRDRMPTLCSKEGDEHSQERPKLNLKPRTLPLPEVVPKPEPEIDVNKSMESEKCSYEKVFGSAKPVDTAARELEIEERLVEARRQEKIWREQEYANIDEKLAEIHLEKTDKDNANSAISWRRLNDTLLINKNEVRNYSPEKKQDDRRRDNRERDYNRYNKNRDKPDRSELPRVRSHLNRDSQQGDDSKAKRDIKPDRLQSKHPLNQSELVLQSSNKYAGLDDEASD